MPIGVLVNFNTDMELSQETIERGVQTYFGWLFMMIVTGDHDS